MIAIVAAQIACTDADYGDGPHHTAPASTTSGDSGDSGPATTTPLPGTTTTPPWDQVIGMGYVWFDQGRTTGAGVQTFAVGGGFVSDPYGEVTLPLLEDSGGAIDDCTVYGGGDGYQQGTAADGGDLTIEHGPWTLVLEPPDYYAAGAQDGPFWGEGVSFSGEGNGDFPSFSFDPLTIFPALPLDVSAPEVLPFPETVSAEEVVFRWAADAHASAPVEVDLIHIGETSVHNFACVVADDGEWALPDRVVRWLDPGFNQLSVDMKRDRTRFVEVEPGRWFGGVVYTQSMFAIYLQVPSR